MLSLAAVPILVRRATVMLLLIITIGLVFGPAGLRTEPQSAKAALVSEVALLLASDADAGDDYGNRVAVSGDIAVVGAEEKDSGAAYVFQRDQGGVDNWGQVKKLTASDEFANDHFGSAVAVSGDTIVVGARERNDGAAYVFQQDEGGADNWGEVKKITASDGVNNDRFGAMLAVSGDVVVVGVRSENAFGLNAGSAYLFERDQGGPDNWGEVKKLNASDAQAGQAFGFSVAASGSMVIVSAPADNSTGAVYVFDRNEGGADNWGEEKKIVASDGQLLDNFGSSVTISGEIALVGARNEDEAALNAGAAYLFTRNLGGIHNWGELQKLTASDPTSNDFFGGSVSISGGSAIVGAAAAGVDTAGAAYVFQLRQDGTDTYGEVAKVIPSGAEAFDNFGTSVAVSNGTAVVGTSGSDAAYVFELPPPKPADGDTDGDTIMNDVDPDDDNDGCSDVKENSVDAAFGGLRDPHNPWDFYDVAGASLGPPDQQIDLFNDIVSVIDHYAPVGTEPEYDAFFDRGPSAGPNQWNMTAPDGKIDLFNDIVGVISQFGHDCR